MHRWDRYLVVCFPTEEDLKDVFGDNIQVEVETPHSCTTHSVQVFSSVKIMFSKDKSFQKSTGIPSKPYICNTGPVAVYNIDQEMLTITARVCEINASGDIVPKS